ncbi:toxin-antitoxin system YwqK family antitoxin [Entomomonas asaccharolytica]|uniref:toxin-antitoxin system YwqK family antitoxin n=1 Tax=Entomomonas asaccharolytica TaxID=2785331 RepID=UPI001F2461A5|nr:toxin-antitoxin system YwqK family antitoxin [Entomomonas asaccharolytica]
MNVGFAQDSEQQTSIITNDVAPEQEYLTPSQIFVASLKEGMIVGYFNQYWVAVDKIDINGYYRKIVKIEDNNSFVVQDFFTDTNKKQSDPVLIHNIYELKQVGFLRSIEGPYVTWYKNGQKQYQSFYNEKGVLDGVIQAWYDSGILKLKGQYDNGKKAGQWTEWHANGRVKSQVDYINNVLSGSYKKWYENGQQHTLGSYKNGLLNGLWIAWGSKGEKVSEGEYSANHRIGLWTYYAEGKKWAEGNYINDLQDGIWTYWKEDGSKDKEIVYQKGVKIKESHFNKKSDSNG